MSRTRIRRRARRSKYSVHPSLLSLRCKGHLALTCVPSVNLFYLSPFLIPAKISLARSNFQGFAVATIFSMQLPRSSGFPIPVRKPHCTYFFFFFFIFSLSFRISLDPAPTASTLLGFNLETFFALDLWDWVCLNRSSFHLPIPECTFYRIPLHDREDICFST